VKRTSAVLLVFLLGSASLAGQAWLTGPVDEALAQAQAKGKLLLLDFYASSG